MKKTTIHTLLCATAIIPTIAFAADGDRPTHQTPNSKLSQYAATLPSTPDYVGTLDIGNLTPFSGALAKRTAGKLYHAEKTVKIKGKKLEFEREALEKEHAEGMRAQQAKHEAEINRLEILIQGRDNLQATLNENLHEIQTLQQQIANLEAKKTSLEASRNASIEKLDSQLDDVIEKLTTAQMAEAEARNKVVQLELDIANKNQEIANTKIEKSKLETALGDILSRQASGDDNAQTVTIPAPAQASSSNNTASQSATPVVPATETTSNSATRDESASTQLDNDFNDVEL